MHKVLRSLRLKNQPLPENSQQLNELFVQSSNARQDRKVRYAQMKHVIFR